LSRWSSVAGCGRLLGELDWIESTETFAAAIDLWLEQNVDH
jgi:hypothetical protein